MLQVSLKQQTEKRGKMTEKRPFDKSKMRLATLRVKAGEITYYSEG